MTGYLPGAKQDGIYWYATLDVGATTVVAHCSPYRLASDAYSVASDAIEYLTIHHTSFCRAVYVVSQ